MDERTAVAENVPTFFKNPRRLLSGIVIVYIKVTKMPLLVFDVPRRQGGTERHRGHSVSLGALYAFVVQKAEHRTNRTRVRLRRKER